MSAEIITVTVFKWEKHNGGKKKGHRAIMVDVGLCDHPKLLTVPIRARLLYLWLLMECGEQVRGTIEYLPRSTRAWTGLKPSEHQVALAALEKNQLLTIDNSPPLLYKRREEKRREENRKEENTREIKNPENPKPEKASAPPTAPTALVPHSKTNFLIAKYCEAWKVRYGSNPPITGKDSGIAKRLAKNLSEDGISKYLDAFFSMPDAHTIKAKHPFEIFEMKLKEIAVFADSGKFVTRTQANQADCFASNQILLEKVRSGEL